MIVIRSGLLAAVAAVRTYLAAAGVTANVECGWKRRFQQGNQGPGGANRVVFVPSAADGAGGTLVPASLPGPRYVRDPNASDPTLPVATVTSSLEWQRSVLVSVWAVDATAPEDESAQIEATESLFEWVVRATYAAPGAFACLEWGDTTWTNPETERQFGRELLAELTFSHPIYDVPRDLVYPAAAAVARGSAPMNVYVAQPGDT